MDNSLLIKAAIALAVLLIITGTVKRMDLPELEILISSSHWPFSIYKEAKQKHSFITRHQ